MSADMKAARKIAERNKHANTTFGTLAAAFLEVQTENKQLRDAIDIRNARECKLQAELESERKAREEAETALFFHHPFQIEGHTPGDSKKMNAVLEDDGTITGATSNGVYVGNINTPWELVKTFQDRAAELRRRLEEVEAAIMTFLETEYPMTRRPLQAAIRNVIRALSAQPNAEQLKGGDRHESDASTAGSNAVTGGAHLPNAQPNAAAGQEPAAPGKSGVGTATPAPAPSAAHVCHKTFGNLCDECGKDMSAAPIPQSKSQYKRLVAQGADVAPPDAALPLKDTSVARRDEALRIEGLELAAGICEDHGYAGTEYGSGREDAAAAIRAEIERRKQ